MSGKLLALNLRQDSVKTLEELDEHIVESPVVQNNIGQVPARLDEQGVIGSKYFERYTPVIDKYLEDSGIRLTDEDKNKITVSMKKKVTGLVEAVPLNCTGEACPFKTSCPFYKLGKAPVGFACPVEGMLMDSYTKRYLDEYGVLSDSFSEVTTMTMLATTHILEMRAFKILGTDENASGIINNVVGYNEDEEPITQLQEHPAFNILERAWRWREKLLSSLVGTRKEKYKREAALKEKASDNSFALKAADLKAKIEKLSGAHV